MFACRGQVCSSASYSFIALGKYHLVFFINCFWILYTAFGDFILLLGILHYFWYFTLLLWLYTAIGYFKLLLDTLHCFWVLYTAFGYFTLLLVLYTAFVTLRCFWVLYTTMAINHIICMKVLVIIINIKKIISGPSGRKLNFFLLNPQIRILHAKKLYSTFLGPNS